MTRTPETTKKRPAGLSPVQVIPHPPGTHTITGKVGDPYSWQLNDPDGPKQIVDGQPLEMLTADGSVVGAIRLRQRPYLEVEVPIAGSPRYGLAKVYFPPDAEFAFPRTDEQQPTATETGAGVDEVFRMLHARARVAAHRVSSSDTPLVSPAIARERLCCHGC